MNINFVKEQAEKHGDFYLYYRKLKGAGVTYLVGTMDFDNKYIQAKHTSGNAGLSGNVAPEILQEHANKQGNVIVWSWTNDKFRTVPAKDIRRVTPLSAEMKHGRNHR